MLQISFWIFYLLLTFRLSVNFEFQMEKDVERLAVRTQKELVLLHRENTERPSNTVLWLNARTWVSSHHHIKCSKRMFSRRSQFRIVT